MFIELFHAKTPRVISRKVFLGAFFYIACLRGSGIFLDIIHYYNKTLYCFTLKTKTN